MIVDLNRGDELVCLSMPSLVKHLKKFFILFLEDLILHRYLVVLNLLLIDFSLKSNFISLLLSLLHTRSNGGVIMCAMASFVPHVGERCLAKRECMSGGNQLDKAERVGISVVSHRRRQMLMHKISEDFGTTECVRFVTFAWLLRSLVKIST
ncbi:hypothetical protein ACFX1R_042691 [Malus domestica]